MRIDKPGQQHAFAGINYVAIDINQRFDFTTTANGFDASIAYQHGAIFNDRELAQITARARAFRARERDDL